MPSPDVCSSMHFHRGIQSDLVVYSSSSGPYSVSFGKEHLDLLGGIVNVVLVDGNQ